MSDDPIRILPRVTPLTEAFWTGGADGELRIRLQAVGVGDEIPELGIAIDGQGDAAQGVAGRDDVSVRRDGGVFVRDRRVVVVEVGRGEGAAGADRLVVGVEVVLCLAVLGLLQDAAGSVVDERAVLAGAEGLGDGDGRGDGEIIRARPP